MFFRGRMDPNGWGFEKRAPFGKIIFLQGFDMYIFFWGFFLGSLILPPLYSYPCSFIFSISIDARAGSTTSTKIS